LEEDGGVGLPVLRDGGVPVQLLRVFPLGAILCNSAVHDVYQEIDWKKSEIFVGLFHAVI
jgi:hypothetical protein